MLKRLRTRLTHNLIANEAGFCAKLMAIYDADPIAKI